MTTKKRKTNLSAIPTPIPTDDDVKKSVQFLKRALKINNSPTLGPSVGIVLGSGLGSYAAKLRNAVTIPFNKIPGFSPTSVEGHVGKLYFGKLPVSNAGKTELANVILLQGRLHYYEGHSIQQVAFPVRVLCALGIHTLILTNAAGGINTGFQAGDIMIINDHINLTGTNPLIGANFGNGPRFPDMSEAYSHQCRQIVLQSAQKARIKIFEGVYAGLTGPSYETPAEIRMLRTMGADAVGMSTVAETIVARHAGVRVLGISTISNMAAGISLTSLTHDEVMTIGKDATEKLSKLLDVSMAEILKQK